MLYERKQLPELLRMKHFHDSESENFDYENNILDKSLSPYIYQNNLMNSYLKKLQPLVSIIFDHMNIIKNFKNYIVDKNEYKHKG